MQNNPSPQTVFRKPLNERALHLRHQSLISQGRVDFSAGAVKEFPEALF